MQWHQKASRNFEFCPMFWWPWYDDTIRWVHQSTTLTSAKRLLCWCTSKLTQSNMGRSPWKLLMSCISQGIERFLHKGMSPYKNVRHSMRRCQATIKMHSHRLTPFILHTLPDTKYMSVAKNYWTPKMNLPILNHTKCDYFCCFFSEPARHRHLARGMSGSESSCAGDEGANTIPWQICNSYRCKQERSPNLHFCHIQLS